MATRKQQLTDDFAAIKKRFANEKACLKGFKLEDEILSCSFANGKTKAEITITVSEYPESCVIMMGDDSIESKGNFDKIFTKIVTDLAKKHSITKDFIEGKEAPKKKKEESDEEDEYISDDGSPIPSGSDGDDGSDLGKSGSSWRNQSMDSAGEMPDDDINENRWMDNEALMLDIHNFKVVFGDHNISVKGMPLLELVEIDLKLQPLDVLTLQTANAWKVDPTLPIVVRISFSDTAYVDSHKPTQAIEIFQQDGTKRLKFGLKGQLENILKNFLREFWPGTSTAPHTITKISTQMVNDAKEKQKQTKDNKKGFFNWLFSSNDGKEKEKKLSSSTSSSTTSTKSTGNVDVEKLQKLVDMGFQQETALDALVKYKNNLEQATAALVGDKEKKVAQIVGTKPTNNNSQPTQSTNDKIKEMFTSPDKYMGAKSVTHGGVQVTHDFGFLVMVMAYLRERIPKLNDFCVICDSPHVFASGNMLKPAVCSRELCCWSFQTLRVGADSAEDIATEAEVIDLLITMVTVAAKSNRKELILEPFPTVFDPAKPDHPVISPQKKDFALINTILSKLPSVEKMTHSKDFMDLKTKMDQSHYLAFPLMQWIITSNRSHIVKIPDTKLIKSMVTPHQYLLLSAPPEKEEAFREYKKKHGSIFAYHGSSIENWHSILRRGLLNASGTTLQVNGAAYGAGIYLAPNASTSFGYSRVYNYNNPNPQNNTGNGNRFLSSDNVFCIAICEVINSEIRKSGGIWVQPREDYVVTRFFCVYTGAVPQTAMNCNTENAAFVEEIKGALDYYNRPN